MVTFLQYREESLAQVINEELITFLHNINKCVDNTVPFLVFPDYLGKIAAKCVRYHAAIYHLAAFHFNIGTRIFLIVSNYRHLRLRYQYWHSMCCRMPDEDSEEEDTSHLFSFISKSIISLSSNRSKRNLGLYPRDTTAIETSSAVASNNPSASSSISLNLNELESSQVPNQGSTLSLNADSSNLENGPALKLPFGRKKLEEDLVNEFSEETQSKDDLEMSELKKLKGLTILINKLKKSVIDTPILFQARFDYETDFDCFTKGELNTVVELYNIPITYTSAAILQLYNFGFGIVKWCDDSHALLILSRRDHATMALLMEHPFIRARPMINASPIATFIACLIDFPTVLKYAHNMQKKLQILNRFYCLYW